jgi:HPt (histidine-containing phosphotransfer) domain-containing protein
MTKEDATDPGWIDRTALLRLLNVVGNDPDELAELVGDYLEDAPDLAGRMVEAAASGDRTAFRIAAHTLKSNARDFGAVRLSDLCAAAETASTTDTNLADLSAAADDIARAEQAARKALADVSLEDLGGSTGTG